MLPRCPLLEEIFNDAATSFDDIYYPPNFTKPPQTKNHREYKIQAIKGLISVLNWWVQEEVESGKLVFWFYAYSYGPCKLRVNVANHGNTISNLITEFNYSHPAIATELRDLWHNLQEKAIEWDNSARGVQKSQCWIDPRRLNPVRVKQAVAALLHKLRHVGSLVRKEREAGGDDEGDYVFCRKGEMWPLVFEGRDVYMKDSKGLRYLAYLINKMNENVGINELYLAVNPPPKKDYRAALIANYSSEELADAGISFSDLGNNHEVIDPAAKRACEYKLEQLEKDYAAEQEQDASKAAGIKEEMDVIRDVLKATSGLHGRFRKMPSPTEKKRKAITNCISGAHNRIDKEHESLGRHLHNSVNTGWICSYKPEKPISWTL